MARAECPGRCAPEALLSSRERNRYRTAVAKTSVNVDRDVAAEAAKILGTRTLRETIDASLREVVNAQRRLELLDLLAEPGRFDFAAAEEAWGGDC